MPVTKDDARAWTAAGTQDTAKKTYASVKNALDTAPELKSRRFEIFLQGSYANATNLRGDSDVDVVAMLFDTISPDISRLSLAQKAAWNARAAGPVTYHEWDFRRDVHAALNRYYGVPRVKPRKKCIRVLKTEGYVDADVVPALQHRLYLEYGANQRYIEGIRIYPTEGPSIVNYPKEHVANGQAKNKRCAERYKPTVRQVKHLRNRAEGFGLLDHGIAPGYLLECMVYNVADHLFVADDGLRLTQVLAALASANLAGFLSCDGIHTLFGTDPGGFKTTDAERIISILRSSLGA